MQFCVDYWFGCWAWVWISWVNAPLQQAGSNHVSVRFVCMHEAALTHRLGNTPLQEWAAFCEFAQEVTSAVDGGRLRQEEAEERVRPAVEYIVSRPGLLACMLGGRATSLTCLLVC